VFCSPFSLSVADTMGLHTGYKDLKVEKSLREGYFQRVFALRHFSIGRGLGARPGELGRCASESPIFALFSVFFLYCMGAEENERARPSLGRDE